jgi:hypothetical protein
LGITRGTRSATTGTIDNNNVADKPIIIDIDINDSSHEKFFVSTVRYFMKLGG